VLKGIVRKGIFELEADTLNLCTHPKRPTDFSHKGQRLWIVSVNTKASASDFPDSLPFSRTTIKGPNNAAGHRARPRLPTDL
jgi:hypothetical protein